MAKPLWSDLIYDGDIGITEIAEATPRATERDIELGDSYNGYLLIGYNSTFDWEEEQLWSVNVPVYNENYPIPTAIYFRRSEREYSMYDVSEDSEFTTPLRIGAGSNVYGYRLSATKPKNWESSADNTKPWILDFWWSIGDYFVIKSVDSHKLFLKNWGQYTPKIYWVEEIEGTKTVEEVPYNPTPPTPPTPTPKYKPVSYLKGNRTFTSLSMIKAQYTNEGEPINVGINTTPFERLILPTLESLGAQLAVGDYRKFAYSNDKNALSIWKLSADEDTTTYRLTFLEDDIDFGLRVDYTINNGEKHYLSLLYDDVNLKARPSIIREYRVVNETHYEYNQEGDLSSIEGEIYYWLNGSRQSDIPDPYNEGGNSTTTPTSTGDFNRDTDHVTPYSAPTLNIQSTGLVRAFLATQQNLKDLSDFLWDAGGFDIDTFKRIHANPIDSIIHLHAIPLALSSSELTHSVHLGNIDTGVLMKPCDTQFVDVDCGSVNINEFYGSYLDYAPYTRVSLYLPYVSMVNLSVDDIMGKTLSVQYRVDVYTGACIALVLVDGEVLYHYAGMCSVDIPITASNYTSVVGSLFGAVSTVASTVATIATKGATAPLLVTSVSTTANNVASAKPQIQRSGSLSANHGFMDNQKPYLIIEIPEQCHADMQNIFKGYPLHKTYTLSDLTGYTEVESVHLENMTCTETEAREIESLLDSGVII